jgi:hypothetical protein
MHSCATVVIPLHDSVVFVGALNGDQAISQNPVRGYFLLIYSHERTDNRLVEKAQTRRPTFWLWVFIVALAALIWPWAHRLYGPGWRK